MPSNSTVERDARKSGARPSPWTLDGMTDAPQFTPAAVGMARWYFRIGGLVVAIAGGLLWTTAQPNAWMASLLVVAGLASFGYSFVRRGDKVANTAREYMDIGPD
jgi:hypothetical protein